MVHLGRREISRPGYSVFSKSILQPDSASLAFARFAKLLS
jgi:hypothetical protein